MVWKYIHIYEDQFVSLVGGLVMQVFSATVKMVEHELLTHQQQSSGVTPVVEVHTKHKRRLTNNNWACWQGDISAGQSVHNQLIHGELPVNPSNFLTELQNTLPCC